jgi:excisionase family DNA binding protein
MIHPSIDFVDVHAGAERIGCALSTVRRHITAGNIPAVKIKGRVYIKVEDLDAFVTPQPMTVARFAPNSGT